jgi:pyrophosphatase PpaX
MYSKYRERKEQCQLFPGIDEIIKDLSNKGFKLAILSNNKRSYLIESLQKYGLDKYFDNILGFNEVSKTKPDPEGLLKILEIEEVSANEALFLGDMITDIQAGKNAEIKTIAIASGLCEKSKLEAQEPYQIVNNTLELKAILEN